ncbi:hypothetical protein GCM10011340_32130 [Roseivirga thermotolerans]|uniref:Uncharacterized protein n=1 Tax=Roseivirga thermotolerans TaxID=1758176 RepID=A0ABQ3I8F5_9BACT|nr:hypothetical protein GCM10011340_32130 [Roseivirga thermotolerans]
MERTSSGFRTYDRCIVRPEQTSIKDEGVKNEFFSRAWVKKEKGICGHGSGLSGSGGKILLDAQQTTQSVLPRSAMAAGQFTHNANYMTKGFGR